MKKVAFTIDLSDSSEADELQVMAPRPSKVKAQSRSKGRGKGKARMDAIELSSDEEGEEMPLSESEGEVLIAEAPIARSPRKVQFKEEPDVEAVADEEEAEPAPKEEEGPKEPDTTPEEDTALATILSIIPDVLPSHVLSLLRQALYSGKAELVIEELLSGNKYPTVEKSSGSKGKKREREPDEGEKEDKVEAGRNYLEVKGRKTMGKEYNDAAFVSLASHSRRLR